MERINAIYTLITVLAGGVSVMLFVSTKTLRDSRDDFAVRIKQLEDERVVDKETIASQKAAVEHWRAAAIGVSDEKLDALTALLTKHHGDATRNWLLVNAGLGHAGRAIDHMSDAIDHLVERFEPDEDDQGDA